MRRCLPTAAGMCSTRAGVRRERRRASSIPRWVSRAHELQHDAQLFRAYVETEDRLREKEH